MKKGGIAAGKKPQYILRLCGLLVPIIFSVYGVLICYFSAPSNSFFSKPFLLVLMSSWLLFGVVQYFFRIRSTMGGVIKLALFHAFSIAFLLGVADFATLLTSFWILLLLACYAFFSYAGLTISLTAFTATAVVDTFIHGMTTPILIDNSITVVAVLITGLALVALTKVQQTDSSMLIASKQQEELQRDSIMALMNNLTDGVLRVSADHKITLYNAATLGLLDTNSSISDRFIDDIVKLYDADSNVVRFTELFDQTQNLAIIDSFHIAAGEENIRLELRISPIRGAYNTDISSSRTHDGYIIIMRDITKAKSLEEERDEFISVVSHELRTPITIAEGTISNAQLLFEKDEVHDDLLKNGLETAHEQVVFLARMVNDLSTLSRAERGIADETEEIHTRELLFDLFKEFQPEAIKKSLKLNINIPAHLSSLQVSRLYLRELLQNFLTNAIKYTKEGSVTLSAHEAEESIIFTVSDTGIGISKTDKEKIFHKFYRSEDYRTRETGGTGLGLYVASKLAKKMNTNIELSSRLNHGSSFSFSLPIKKN